MFDLTVAVVTVPAASAAASTANVPSVSFFTLYPRCVS
jgi:hypothetical protein